MICNCNNSSNNTLITPKILVVYGNVLRMAIPLTVREIELVDGEITATNVDFIPSSKYPINVILSKDAIKIQLNATIINGNVVYIEDDGTIPIGTYEITITCSDDMGKPYRFNQESVLKVVKTTSDAGIEPSIEYDASTWYLDSAIFLALKGEGIADIQTESSSEIGGMNVVTILLTNGETRTFTVMNGSGTVDQVLNILSLHPISNKAVTERFAQVDERLAELFGDVDYDSQSKSIRFWDKGKTNVLVNLDARPFIKDGMVRSAYISNNTLVITFNTDSGKEAIGVPLSSIFNPNNYYNKTQIDNRLASLNDAYLMRVYYEGNDGHVTPSKSTQVVLYSMGDEYDDGDTTPVGVGLPVFQNGYIMIYNRNGQTTSLGQPQTHLVYCNAKTNKLYRWGGSEFVQVGGSGNGIKAVYDATNQRIIFPTGSATVVNERLIIS